MLPDDARVDFRAREKGEKDRPETREEIHPFGDVQAYEVAGEHTDHDLDQGDGNRDPDGNEGCQQREAEPQRGTKPDICHDRLPCMSAVERKGRGGRHKAGCRRNPTATSSGGRSHQPSGFSSCLAVKGEPHPLA